jgi:molybdate transport system substrate-binding protein
MQQIVPEFSNATGIEVAISTAASQGNGPNTIGAQLGRGLSADLVIMSREGLDQLIADGGIASGSDMNLARTPLSAAVRAGAPKPDITTADAFKRTLLAAKSITFPESTTGIYMQTTLFPRMGIADALQGKITHAGVAAVAGGEAEIAIQPVSELLHAAGTDYIGTIPQEDQYIPVFATALVTGSKETTLARRLIDFLTAEASARTIRLSGMEPMN